MSIFAAQSFAFIFLVGKEYYCPLGWSMYGEKCIMVINHEKTWLKLSYCLFEGGNLASVHSDLENHFIEALTKDKNYDFPETWLGGYDAIQTCMWFWSDGTKFNYENWFMDYYMERKEHCLKMNYGRKYTPPPQHRLLCPPCLTL
uniref:C-type lectin domain-containing protein n=1 Tax=Labrus bergylta TaxID=56723 RepID=A0A3Q3GHI0_9LABR